MKKLSFKEYLESKNKLRESVEATSRCTATYSITKYCRLVIGEKNSKTTLSLKPNQKIIIEWFYTHPDTPPTPVSILFEGLDDLIEKTFSTYWSGDKLLKWLEKNSIQKFS